MRGAGLGHRVQGLRFRVKGSGFRVQGSGSRVQGSGFRATPRSARAKACFLSQRTDIAHVNVLSSWFASLSQLSTLGFLASFHSIGIDPSRRIDENCVA
jgi:hypothetical protein